MYNGNGLVVGGVAGGSTTLAATGATSGALALVAVAMILVGFIVARQAAARSAK